MGGDVLIRPHVCSRYAKRGTVWTCRSTWRILHNMYFTRNKITYIAKMQLFSMPNPEVLYL